MIFTGFQTARARARARGTSKFKDVVFEDVVFDDNRFYHQ